MLGHNFNLRIKWAIRRYVRHIGLLSPVSYRNVESNHPTDDVRHTRPCLRSIRAITMAPCLLRSSPPRDCSLPNASWSSEMLRLYEHYNSMCEVETERGDKIKGQWTRLASYKRSLDFGLGRGSLSSSAVWKAQYLSKLVQANACLFPRNIEEQGAGFEYAVFSNHQEKTCVCVFQAGHLLEGLLGCVHGGAIATILDSVMWANAVCHFGAAMTANFTIDYHRAIPLGSVVLIHSSLEKSEGRVLSVSAQVTSSDGSKLYTEATALFIQMLETK